MVLLHPLVRKRSHGAVTPSGFTWRGAATPLSFDCWGAATPGHAVLYTMGVFVSISANGGGRVNSVHGNKQGCPEVAQDFLQ